MLEYTIEMSGTTYCVMDETGSELARTSDYKVAKYIFYGPLLYSSLKTISKLISKMKSSRLKKIEKTVIQSAVEEATLLLRLVEK